MKRPAPFLLHPLCQSGIGPFILSSFLLAVSARAELKLPAIISDHMVLQQKQTNPIWGWDTPGTKVTVTFGDQTKSGEAGADGKWTVKLDPVPANAKPQTISIAGTNKKEIQDVLVGEVWMCSGQSNMGFTLGRDWNGDLEANASKIGAFCFDHEGKSHTPSRSPDSHRCANLLDFRRRHPNRVRL